MHDIRVTKKLWDISESIRTLWNPVKIVWHISRYIECRDLPHPIRFRSPFTSRLRVRSSREQAILCAGYPGRMCGSHQVAGNAIEILYLEAATPGTTRTVVRVWRSYSCIPWSSPSPAPSLSSFFVCRAFRLGKFFEGRTDAPSECRIAFPATLDPQARFEIFPLSPTGLCAQLNTGAAFRGPASRDI